MSKKVKNPHTTLPIHALIKLHIGADLPLYSPFRPDIKDINLRCITDIPYWGSVNAVTII
jgi:hypothetical protein